MNACMGGWCHRREQCPHYHAVRKHDPAERLCLPGTDGVQLEQIHGHAQEVHIFPSRLPTAESIVAEAA